jgi:uncharacterized protein (DUF1778 family)
MDRTQTEFQPHDHAATPAPQPPEGTCSVRLSERDEAQVLAAAENPPAPNEAALQAARRFMQRNG